MLFGGVIFIFIFTVAGWYEQRYIRTRKMITSETLDVKLRTCAIPKDNVCPRLLTIPKNSVVSAYQKTEIYTQSDGHRATWRKVEYQKTTGWVNESLLRDLEGLARW